MNMPNGINPEIRLHAVTEGRFRDFWSRTEGTKRCYSPSRRDAGAKWDQQLALLFTKSGWTQEQLAKKEGKQQQWISRRLTFGRFLNFSTNVLNPEIPLHAVTEGRFRDFWSRTEGTNERQRFSDVLKLMQQEVSFRRPPLLQGISKAIVAEFADGKWHKFETIVAAVEGP
jgi:hypothetical protein